MVHPPPVRDGLLTAHGVVAVCEQEREIVVGARVAFLAVTNTGQIQKSAFYGSATVKGFELEAGGDYMLTRSIFARAAFKVETISLRFEGNGFLTSRDADPEPDVYGARDTYYGGTTTIGVLY